MLPQQRELQSLATAHAVAAPVEDRTDDEHAVRHVPDRDQVDTAQAQARQAALGRAQALEGLEAGTLGGVWYAGCMAAAVPLEVGTRFSGEGWVSRLVSVEYSPTSGGSAKADFQCDCGTIVYLYIGSVKSGRTRSCGCFNELCRVQPGEVYGELLVLERTSKRSVDRSAVYECLCSCGQITYVLSGSLRTGHTVSCGCRNILATIARGDMEWSGSVKKLGKTAYKRMYRALTTKGATAKDRRGMSPEEQEAYLEEIKGAIGRPFMEVALEGIPDKDA